jgi:hypothetical protein
MNLTLNGTGGHMEAIKVADCEHAEARRGEGQRKTLDEENIGYGGKGGRGRNPETWGKESRGGLVELFDLKGLHSSNST